MEFIFFHYTRSLQVSLILTKKVALGSNGLPAPPPGRPPPHLFQFLPLAGLEEKNLVRWFFYTFILLLKRELWIHIGFHPDPAYYLKADPDPGSQTNADTDPG